MSKWPDEVPILSARDICRVYIDGDNGTHCLLGWINVAFKACPEPIRHAVREAIRHEAGSEVISDFNDKPSNSKAKVANAWNRAMAKLGYTEVQNA